MRAMVTMMMVLAGCTGGGPVFEGTNLPTYFEFENNIGSVWTYANDDLTVPYRLRGEITNFIIAGEATEYTMSFNADCIGENDPDCNDNELIREIIFTSNFAGVRILSVDGTRYDTPIQLGDQFMKIGETTTSTTNGSTYTSTFTATEAECPVLIPNFNQCPRLDIAGDPANPDVDGTYWVAASFALVAMDWEGQPGIWRMSTFDLPE